jgi:hypothetical protein
MSEKKTHFGRAGEYFAMSELLLRGWNVAVPVVDIGDDVFVIDDNDKTTWRLQVKAARAERTDRGVAKAKFKLSRQQLRTPLQIELFYMLLVRDGDGWRFLVLPRDKLFRAREDFVEARRLVRGSGRPPVADHEAKGDGLLLEIEIAGTRADAWGCSLSEFLDQWPAALPELLASLGAGQDGRQVKPPVDSTTREEGSDQ